MTEEKKKDNEFVLVQVPTEHTLAVKTPEGDIISPNELLVRLANTIEDLKLNLIGNK